MPWLRGRREQKEMKTGPCDTSERRREPQEREAGQLVGLVRNPAATSSVKQRKHLPFWTLRNCFQSQWWHSDISPEDRETRAFGGKARPGKEEGVSDSSLLPKVSEAGGDVQSALYRAPDKF